MCWLEIKDVSGNQVHSFCRKVDNKDEAMKLAKRLVGYATGEVNFKKTGKECWFGYNSRYTVLIHNA